MRPQAFILIVLLQPLLALAQPANDAFASRIALAGISNTIHASVTGATAEPAESRFRAYTAKSSVWWSWTAPTNGRLLAKASWAWSLPGSSFVVGVFAGNSLAKLKPLDEASTEASAPVIAGRTYVILADRSYGTEAEFDLSVQLLAPPSNDDFKNAQEIVGARATVYVGNAGATPERGERPLGVGRTVWYSWQAPASSHVRLSVTNGSLGFGVFRGKSLRGPRRVLFDPDSNLVEFDAIRGTRYFIALDSTYRSSPQRFMFLDLTTLRMASPTDDASVPSIGSHTFSIHEPDAAIDGAFRSVTYFVSQDFADNRIGTATEPPFSITVSNLPVGWRSIWVVATNEAGEIRRSPAITLKVRPLNDDFTNALEKNGYEWSVYAYNLTATREPGEPAHNASVRRNGSVWYSWTAPADGRVSLTVESLSGRLYRNAFVAYTGAEITKLRRVPVKYFFSHPGFFFDAEAGETYHFVAAPDTLEQEWGFDAPDLSLTLRTVRVTGPAGDTTFAEGDDVPFQIETTELTSAITGVDYYAGTNLIGTALAPPFSFVWTNATAGEHEITVQLRRADGQQPLPDYQQVIVRPANDDFTNAIVLTNTSIELRFTLDGSSLEPGEVAPFENRSVWFSWTAPADGFLVIGGSGFFPALHLYTGISVSNLTVVTNAAVGPSAAVQSNVTYHIAATSHSALGDATLKLNFHLPPANDYFTNSTGIAGTNLYLRGLIIGATREEGEPRLANGFGETLWWKWTAPADGNVHIATSGDVMLGVYEGAFLATLVPILTGQYSYPGSFRARAGVTYRLLLERRYGPQELSANLLFVPAPVNDDFSDRVILTGLPAAYTGTLRGASREPNEPRAEVGRDGNSIWFSWTALESRRVIATAPGTTVSVFHGDNFPTQHQVGVQQYADSVYFDVLAGQAYAIRLSEYGGVLTDTNDPPIELRIRPFELPPNDQLSNPVIISGVSGTVTGENWGCTPDYGEFVSLRRTLWYRFVEPSIGLFVATNLPGKPGVLINAYERDWSGRLIPMGDVTEGIEITWATGAVLLQVDRADGEGGSIDFGYELRNARKGLPDVEPHFELQSSTNLVNWEVIGTTPQAQFTESFLREQSRNGETRFFRIVPVR